jgi:hypothetical protein
MIYAALINSKSSTNQDLASLEDVMTSENTMKPTGHRFQTLDNEDPEIEA